MGRFCNKSKVLGIVLGLSCLCWREKGFGQANFVTKGKVTYTRTINQYNLLGEYDSLKNSGAGKMLMSAYPKVTNDRFDLWFNESKSYYTFAKDNEAIDYMLSAVPVETDGVLQDMSHKTAATERTLNDVTYLIKDSLRKLEWRITDDRREIAGFDCRKAVTKICDSVYVVAFFCDQIPVYSGPETMGGLPGLILGLAVPRLHTTWFATKIEANQLDEQKLQHRQKGKLTTWRGFKDMALPKNKASDPNLQRNAWWFFL